MPARSRTPSAGLPELMLRLALSVEALADQSRSLETRFDLGAAGIASIDVQQLDSLTQHLEETGRVLTAVASAVRRCEIIDDAWITQLGQRLRLGQFASRLTGEACADPPDPAGVLELW